MPSLRSAFAAHVLPLALGSLSFDHYLRRYQKSYSVAEYEERKALFELRSEEVVALNARPGALWTAGLNALSDLQESELQQHRGYDGSLRDMDSEGGGKIPGSGSTMRAFMATELPESLDWRDHKPAIVTPVKKQGSCGSCWAFAAVESIESHIALTMGKLLSLSPQQLTSCTPNPSKCGGSGGCTGATAQLGFNYTVHSDGLSDMWDWPYESGITGEKGECHETTGQAVARITGFTQLPRNDPQALLEAVATVGPVAIIVDASKWYLYESGIFNHCNKTNPNLNHAVQLVGYGASNGTKYWLVRNSWGVMWGEDGYIRVRRYHSTSRTDGEREPCGEDIKPQSGYTCEGGPSSVEACGECGILSDSAYPVGGSYGYAWTIDDIFGDDWRRLQANLPESAPIHV